MSQNGKSGGETAVVTDAASGIGRALALALVDGTVDGVSTTVEDVAQTAFERAPRTGQSFVVSHGLHMQ